MEAKKPLNILFVDDEPHLLASLRRSLRKYTRHWNLQFAKGGEQALDCFKHQHIAIIVTDMRMPGMNGGELLNAVREISPITIRLVLSGEADRDLVYGIVPSAHLFLAKPCPLTCLTEHLERAVNMSGLLENTPLQALINNLGDLPSIPELYSQLVDELHSDDPSIDHVGRIISNDPGISAKLLQLVNSAFFGLPRQINSVQDATALLGLDIISALVLSEEVFRRLDSETDRKFDVKKLWAHIQRTVVIAKAIATFENFSHQQVGTVMIATLLHDIGKIVLVDAAPDAVEAVLESNTICYLSDEKRVHGANYADIGAYILALWGLPNTVVNAIAKQTQTKDTGIIEPNISIANIIYIADQIDEVLCENQNATDSDIAAHFPAVVQKNQRLKSWAALARDGSSA